MAHNEEVRLHFLDYWRVIRVRWVLIVLAFLLVVITTAIVTYFQPRLYQSSVFIEAVANEALMLNSGLGENHPKVKALRATKAVYIHQLEQQVASVRDALRRNLNSAEATRDRLKKQLDEINNRQVASKNLSAN